MKFTTTCTHCGHKVTAYTVPMNEGLARAFVGFAEARIRFGRPIAKHELALDNVQYTMFQKLRHFGLICKPDLSGRCWEITALGLAWYFGRQKILAPAGWMGARTLADDDLVWQTHRGGRKQIALTDIFPEGWKPREDYVAEKVGT